MPPHFPPRPARDHGLLTLSCSPDWMLAPIPWPGAIAMSLLRVIAACFCLLSSGVSAGPITYGIQGIPGSFGPIWFPGPPVGSFPWPAAFGSIQGSITTDGTIGVLSSSNITSFSFVLGQWDPGHGGTGFGMGSPDIGGHGQVTIVGSALTATQHQLLFDFNAPDSYVKFFDTFLNPVKNFFCLETGGSLCSGFPHNILVSDPTGSVGRPASEIWNADGVLRSDGILQFAGTGPLVSVPLRPSLLLNAAFLTLLCCFAWRRRRTLFVSHPFIPPDMPG